MNPAVAVFRYLAVREEKLEPADLIIGFGHFDPKIPRRCCELFNRRLAPRILFTGGVGAGSADIGTTEAEFFMEIARQDAPSIPDSAIFIEQNSTNTGENLAMSREVLANLETPLRFGHELRRVILVANAYRQRRVYLSARRRLEGVALQNAPPITSYEEEHRLFDAKGESLDLHLCGEVERIQRYPARGYMAYAALPMDVLIAVEDLCGTLADTGEAP
jgi:hypothetical protein